MVTLAVAIIGFIGVVLASGGAAEWLKSRDLRESIKRDLELYKALPEESGARANLLASIERRANALARERQRVPWLYIGYAVFALVVTTVILGAAWINGDSGFRRDDDGILRWYGTDGESITFLYLAGVVGLIVFIAGFGTYLFETLIASRLPEPEVTRAFVKKQVARAVRATAVKFGLAKPSSEHKDAPPTPQQP